jgi:hypothetical protein
MEAFPGAAQGLLGLEDGPLYYKREGGGSLCA